MASAIVRQPCIKCDKGFGKNMCGGCQQWFCKIHHNEHQKELFGEMDDITQKHDELHSHLTMENMDSEHPLLLRINHWEQQSVHRIHTAANEARSKLKQSLDRVKKEFKASLSHIADELKLGRTSEDYNKIELKRWMDQLESLKQQLKNPTEFELYGGTQADTNTSMIRLVRLKMHQIISKLM
jgi:hypothetical protein